MNTTREEWLIPTGLIALSLVPAIAGTARMAELARGAEVTAANARFIASPAPIVMHVIGALLFSLLGAFQFAPGFRRRHRKLHRATGKLGLVGGFFVALSGLWMAQFYPWPAGDGIAVYIERLIAGTWMLASLVMSIDAIRRRNFSSHGDWMTRAYAIGLGAGTQVFTHLPWFIFVDHAPGESARGVMMGAAWVINFAVAEWIIRQRLRAHASVGRERSRTSAANEGRLTLSPMG